MGVPWQRTSSVATKSISGTTMPSMPRIMPMGGKLSSSAPVTTATTPAALRAMSMSSAATRAWACGLRTKTT